MKLALLSNVGVELVAELLRPEDEVWLAPGYGAWRQICLEPPADLREFAPEIVALLIDHSEVREDERRGTGGAKEETEDLMDNLRRVLPGAAVVCVDLEDLADEVESFAGAQGGGLFSRSGGPRFYDARIRALAGCPWSLAGQKAIVREIRRLAAVRHAPPKKALAVDFDGVLWRGTLAEDGAAALVPAGDFQRALLELKRRGILLVGLTKNDAADVEDVWAHPKMVLQRDDFVLLRADWNEKGANLAGTARELNLGTDAFVFADDNPGECAAMAAAHPEVETFLVTEPTAAVARRLVRLHFPDFGATAEDRGRTESYRAEAARRASAAGRTLEDYLASLGTEIDFHPARADEVPRLAQLSQRCNQFNACQRRYTEADLLRLVADPRFAVWSVAVRDRFGDLGLVSLVVVAFPETGADGASAAAGELVEWVMSCRAMNRRVEDEIWARLADALRARGLSRLAATVRPTAKNAPVGNFFGARDRLDLAR